MHEMKRNGMMSKLRAQLSHVANEWDVAMVVSGWMEASWANTGHFVTRYMYVTRIWLRLLCVLEKTYGTTQPVQKASLDKYKRCTAFWTRQDCISGERPPFIERKSGRIGLKWIQSVTQDMQTYCPGFEKICKVGLNRRLDVFRLKSLKSKASWRHCNFIFLSN